VRDIDVKQDENFLNYEVAINAVFMQVESKKICISNWQYIFSSTNFLFVDIAYYALLGYTFQNI